MGSAAANWNYRAYGTASDPIHKSHLNAITGDYGCPRRFRYDMDARANRLPGADERDTVGGKAAAGTAAHETIARALTKPEVRDRLLAGGVVTREQVSVVFAQEYVRELGGRAAQWYRDSEADECDERISMIVGLLNRLHERVARVLAVEPGFIAPLGEYWLSGHIDLIYAPRDAPDAIAMCDWKTGASKPVQVELDHGWEAGVYSAAMHAGMFIARDQINCSATNEGKTVAVCGAHAVEHSSRYIAEREALERALIDLARYSLPPTPFKAPLVTRFDCFPAQIHHVHLADYVPYKKAGKKAVKRPEDLAHYGYTSAVDKHAYVAGDMRGPAWLPVELHAYDLPRLEARLRNVVGMIRMGRFIDQVGERCNRCSHSVDCLSSGYAPRGEERKQLDLALRSVDVDDGMSAGDE